VTTTAFYGDDLAYVHHAGFSGFSRAAAPAILHLLHAAGVHTGRIVELGCGSGVLARALTSTGYEVTGIDRSAAMLRIARRMAPRARFRLGPLQTVALPPCEAVISIGEAIGYLPAGAAPRRLLAPLFARVHRALPPGGLFVFDLLVDTGGRRRASYRDWHAGDDWVVLIEARERAGTLTRDITVLRETGGGRYRRSRERHAARVFDAAAVVRSLRAAGFSVRTRRRYGPAAPLLPRRLVFVARRGAARQSVDAASPTANRVRSLRRNSRPLAIAGEARNRSRRSLVASTSGRRPARST